MSYGVEERGQEGMLRYNIQHNTRPPMTREEEVQYFTHLREVEAELAKKRTLALEKEREKITTEVVKANTRFVVYIAITYCSKRTPPLDDLIEEGLVGLIEAYNRYDVDTGVPFLGYASFWVRWQIVSAIEKHIMSTRYFQSKISHLNKLRRELEQEQSREVPIQKLLEEGGFSKEEILSYLFISSGGDIHWGGTGDVDTEDPARGRKPNHLSWEEVTPDEEAVNPEEVLEKQEQREILQKALDALVDRRQRHILKAYNGFFGKEMTFEEIASDLGVRRQWISRIYEKAINELRRPQYGLDIFTD
jgi:RNA polymerase sigma factor (sigma-70 family)